MKATSFALPPAKAALSDVSEGLNVKISSVSSATPVGFFSMDDVLRSASSLNAPLGSQQPAFMAIPTALSPEERRRFVAENTFDLICETDAAGRYLFVSPNHEQSVGYTPEELLGTHSLQHIHPEDIERVGRVWPEMFASGQGKADFRYRHKNGEWRWFEGVGRRVVAEDGSPRYVSVCRDITDRKHFEAELITLNSLGRVINGEGDLNALVAKISSHLKPFLPFDTLFLTLLQNDVLRQIATDSGGKPEWIFPTLPRAEFPHHPLWERLDRGEIWAEEDYGLDVTKKSSDALVRAFINVPLIVEGQTLGLLHIDVHHPYSWTNDQIRLAGLVGEQIAATVQSVFLLEERKRQGTEVEQSNALLRATQEAAADGMCLVDDEGQLVSYNRRFAQLWNLETQDESDLAAQGQVMAYVLSQMADADEFIEKIAYLYDHPHDSTRDETRLIDERIFERYSAPAVSSDGQSFGRVWSFFDISDRKKYEERLTHQAFHDAVTGLPNRLLFVDRLSRALARLERSHKMTAVLFLDLDRFKVVNDSLGHEKGDQLLIQVAARLNDSLRPGDTAARFGGDEFTILLEDVASPQDAIRIAERVAASLQTPFSLGGHDVQVTASVGIVLSQSFHDSPEELLRKADVAMYRAKNRGRAQYEVFSEQLSDQALERLELELDLGHVLSRQELQLHYQPLVDLKSGQITAFEALLRWQHPKRGMISPAVFVPVAEETGLIVPIGAWALRQACEQAVAWNQTENPNYGQAITMHVNLSARQFEQTDLTSEIARILEETGLPPAQLMLEITESAVMTDAKSAALTLEELKKLGVSLSIDDFGTGYSSLSYLEFFPIDLLKIDRAFVARLSEGTAIVRAVATLGQAMNIEVAAEGIETPEQLAQLRALNCRWGQGYLFSRPVPPEEAVKLLGQRF